MSGNLIIVIGIASVVSLSDERQIHITADQAQQNLAKRTAVWHGNVLVRDGVYTLTSDTLTVTNNTSGQPCVVTAIGRPVTANGPIKGETAHASGQHVRYDCNQQRAKLSGAAQLNTAQQSLRANNIVYDFIERNLHASGSVKTRSRLTLNP